MSAVPELQAPPPKAPEADVEGGYHVPQPFVAADSGGAGPPG